MKKTVIILGSLLVVLIFAVSGFSKNVTSRKLAQSKITEKEVGSIHIFERTFETSFEMCKQNFIMRGIDKGCEVKLLERDKTVADLSSPRDYLFIKNSSSGKRIEAALHAWHNGYAINIMGPDDQEVSEEEFFDAAKTLLTKHPKVNVTYIKFPFESGVPE